MRAVHTILNDCDIFVQRMDANTVRVRITEKNTEVPTDFEIEGDPVHIAEMFSVSASIIFKLDSILRESPN